MPEQSDSKLDLHVSRNGTHRDARRVVMSHGVGSSAEVWADWVPTLSAVYETVCWDQPGHGLSPDAAPGDYGPRLAYGALSQVVGDDSGVVLLGHSLGGYLSCRYAIQHPERVAALVLVSTGPGFRAQEAMDKWNASQYRAAEKLGRPAMLVGLHEDTYVMDHLSQIACPTLALIGSQDDAFLGATDYLQKKLPDIERHTIEGAGHMMPETHGAELAAIVAEFLARRL